MTPHNSTNVIERENFSAIVAVRQCGQDFAAATRPLADDLDQRRIKNVVLDCSASPCFDCATLGQFLRLSKLVAGYRGHVVLCGLSPQQNEVLRLVNLHRRWPMFPTREAAVQAIRKATGRLTAHRPDAIRNPAADAEPTKLAPSIRPAAKQFWLSD